MLAEDKNIYNMCNSTHAAHVYGLTLMVHNCLTTAVSVCVCMIVHVCV